MANPNYITPDGARRLSEELGRLRSVERAKVVQEVADAAAQGDRSENAEYIYGKKKLREIDRRMRYLTKRLESAVVVDPKTQKGEKIFFGATVDVLDEEERKARYRIVGEDEIDSKTGAISWRSPVGHALLGKSVGDVVVVQRPAGAIELEIMKISYI